MYIHIKGLNNKCEFVVFALKFFLFSVLKIPNLSAKNMSVFRGILGPIVKEACPVGNCPATMEVAVHLPQGAHVAPAFQAMAGPSVSITVMKAAPPSPVAMEGCALKRPASRSFTASVPVAGRVNGASRVADLLNSQHPHALGQTVRAKPVMAFVTRSATHSLVAGMVATAL